MKTIFKIVSILLVYTFLLSNLCWAQQGELCPQDKLSMLSPALQMSSQLMQGFFMQQELFEVSPRIGVLVMERVREGDKYLGKIEMHFKHDHPGILHNILLKIGPNAVMTWLAMFKQNGMNVIRFGIQSKDKKEIDEVIDRLTQIEDIIQETSQKIKTKACVLDLDLLYQERDLMIIASFFKKEHINVARFLTPVLAEKGYSHFVFELEIPEGEDKRIERELKDLADKIGGIVKLRMGKLIDRILYGYLLKDLNITQSKKLSKRLRGALKIIIRRRMSMSRKDLKTPFVMHPVEVARIFVNEVGLFTPQAIAYLAKTLGISEEELITEVLISALLHDAVEDGDISSNKLQKIFHERITDIVSMLSKEQEHKIRAGEAAYFQNMINRNDINALIAVLIKIADRIHNLRTLKDNEREFQRKIFFSTLDTFVPEFIDKINLKAIKNKELRRIFKQAITLFSQEKDKTGIELGLLDGKKQIDKQEHKLYQTEESLRERKLILEVAKKRKFIAHGIDETKGGIKNLSDILTQKYIKANHAELGKITFAGALRPQGKDEIYLDYITESSGDYGPFYIILNPRFIKEFKRAEIEVDGKKFLLPGFYSAKKIKKNKWGISHVYHQAYLVPIEKDRGYLIKKLEQAVESSEITREYRDQVKSKIITYFEFLKYYKNNSQNNKKFSSLSKNNQMPLVKPPSILPSILFEQAI